MSRPNALKASFFAALLGAAALLPASSAVADEQYFPLQSYRVGPYAAGGTGFFGGFIDYLNLINTRDGGVNGVTLTWDECETQYEVERGVILDALLPQTPATLAAPEGAPKDLLASAERMRQLERLKAMNLITDPEMKAELAALEAGLRSGSASASPGPVATVPLSGGPQMLIPGGSRAAVSPPLPGQTTVHLASYRTEAQAQAGWADLLKRFPKALGTLAPDVRRTPVPGQADTFRLYAGPLATQGEAAAVCRALAAKRQFCKVTND